MIVANEFKCLDGGCEGALGIRIAGLIAELIAFGHRCLPARLLTPSGDASEKNANQ